MRLSFGRRQCRWIFQYCSINFARHNCWGRYISQMGTLCCPFVCLSRFSFCHPVSSLARFLLEAFPSSGVSFHRLWLSLLRSFLRVSFGRLVRLVVSPESRMLETFFRPPSMSLDLSIMFHQFRQAEFLGTLPGTLFRRLSDVLSTF